MFLPEFDAFAGLYEAGEPSLVSLRLVADLETPVSAFLKLSHGRAGDVFLLELVEGGAARGRYSMIGLDPDVIFRVQDGKAEINRDARRDREAFAAMRGKAARRPARPARRIGHSRLFPGLAAHGGRRIRLSRL